MKPRRDYLCTGIGTGEEDTRNLTGKRAGVTSTTAVGESCDCGNRNLFLAETGFGKGHKGREEERLGRHVEFVYR